VRQGLSFFEAAADPPGAVSTLRQQSEVWASPAFFGNVADSHCFNIQFLPGHAMRSASFSASAALRTLLVSGAVLTGVAHAQTVADNAAALELAKTNGCLSCHAMKEKVVGPAYSAIAEKYKDDKDAVPSLVQSIQRGSKGKWGRVPMPAHDTMSQEDLKILATWVMSSQP
jgi:cytochrome c